MVVELGPSCIYSEAQVPERFKTWDNLKSIVVSDVQPWLVIGDFNEVLHHSEHDGIGHRSQSQLDGFRDALDICGLTDLGFSGSPWTFEKKVTGGSYTGVRLDRAVADPSWCVLFSVAQIAHEAAACSDHVALVLNFSEELRTKKGTCPLKYELMWETHSELKTLMEQGWKKNDSCTLVSELHDKLKSLTGDLASWDRHTFGSVRAEIKKNKQRVGDFMQCPGSGWPKPCRSEDHGAASGVILQRRDPLEAKI